MSPVRRAAAEVLIALEDPRRTLAAEIDTARAPLADVRDRGLLLELVAGTLRWRGQLDALVAAASRRSIGAIDPPTRAVLRLAVYQLRHLTRIPPHAIVHESVDLVRAVGRPRAAGFVNATLRAVIRRGPALGLPPRPTPDAPEPVQVRYLSLTLSHPAWLVTRWLRRYGFDATERWCLFNNASPSITVRPRGPTTPDALIAALTSAGIAAVRAPFADEGIRLPPGTLGSLPPALREALLVQDEGAQLVAAAAAPVPGERLLDLCAAPGGKTLLIAGILGRGPAAATSHLVAADVRPARVALLAQHLRAAGLDTPIVRLDATHPLPFGPIFDCVLLDAPCSGLGTLRRDPDLKWTRTEADLAPLAAAATRMAGHAADVLRPGGRLLYATCSSEPEENEGVVDALATARPDLRRTPVRLALPADALVNGEGHLATRPFLHGLDAFFAATLVRRSAA